MVYLRMDLNGAAPTDYVFDMLNTMQAVMLCDSHTVRLVFCVLLAEPWCV